MANYYKSAFDGRYGFFYVNSKKSLMKQADLQQLTDFLATYQAVLIPKSKFMMEDGTVIAGNLDRGFIKEKFQFQLDPEPKGIGNERLCILVLNIMRKSFKDKTYAPYILRLMGDFGLENFYPKRQVDSILRAQSLNHRGA